MSRRRWTAALAVALLAIGTQGFAQQGQAGAPAHTPLTFSGDVALWTIAIKPDKTADFEKVAAKLHDALQKSSKPERREQAKGWRIMRMSKPLPDGNVAYVHVIDPVVPNADYTLMQILYDEFPDERQQLYELYRGAFAQNLALAVGDVAVDMAPGEAPAAPAAVAARD
jgi:hypothetical protein